MHLKYTINSRCHMGHISVSLQHHCVQVKIDDTHDVQLEISQKETGDGEKVLSMIMRTILLNIMMKDCDDDNESRLKTDQFQFAC